MKELRDESFTLLDATIILVYEYKRRLKIVAVMDAGDEWGAQTVLTLRYHELRRLIKELSGAGYRIAQHVNLNPTGAKVFMPLYSAHRGITDEAAGRAMMTLHNIIVTWNTPSGWQS